MAVFISDGQTSASNDAVRMTTYADDYIIRGKAFKAIDVVDIDGGDTIYFSLDPTLLKDSQSVFILPINIQSSAERIALRVYENTDYTGGTIKQYYNANRNASDSYDFVVKQGALTGTVKGTLLQQHTVFATSQGINESASQGGSSNALVLNNDYVYLFEVENLGSGSTTMEYDTTIYQI